MSVFFHKGEEYLIEGESYRVTKSEYDECAKEHLCKLRSLDHYNNPECVIYKYASELAEYERLK